MNIKTVFLVAAVVFFGCVSAKKISQQTRVLVLTATKGARHKSVTDGKMALLKIGAEKHWLVDTTEDATVFTIANLKTYKAIVFINTTGNILNDEQQVAFQQYIQAGGGFVGIHSATDTEKDWPWYNNLVGAIFADHPKQQVALYNVVNKKHPAVAFMPDTIRRMEEIYNFKSFKKDLVNVLITVDEKSYTGGKMGDYHPIAWYHTYDGGKAFYTEWGHQPEAYREPLFLKHITTAIEWAIAK
jgi:uncharacterized protein